MFLISERHFGIPIPLLFLTFEAGGIDWAF
jgi:hypothetical protein